jgi:hypothetical protein
LRERSFLVDQYFNQMINAGAAFELKYFSREKINAGSYEERIRFTKEMLSFLKDNL